MDGANINAPDEVLAFALSEVEGDCMLDEGRALALVSITDHDTPAPTGSPTTSGPTGRPTTASPSASPVTKAPTAEVKRCADFVCTMGFTTDASKASDEEPSNEACCTPPTTTAPSAAPTDVRSDPTPVLLSG